MKEVNPEHVCVATALTFPKYHDELFELKTHQSTLKMKIAAKS